MSQGNLNRRQFLGSVAAGAAGTMLLGARGAEVKRQPNLVYVFADQWRASASGYAGDPNAQTPNLDLLAKQSVNFTHAVSGCPVCTPYRASLMTGQYWTTHGVFLNDVPLRGNAMTFAEALNEGGYDTAYIGKWHLDGQGRSAYTPPERRKGFKFWRALECSHDYNHSAYYADTDEKLYWEGYDAFAQTDEAIRYMREQSRSCPFALFMSWGSPHDPYNTAPEEYRKRFDPANIVLPPNVPKEHEEEAREELAGYYAHMAALDDCLGRLLKYLEESKLANDTVFVFTSDHGDMLHSQGQQKKQRPFDESIRVPFLMRYPTEFGYKGREKEWMLNTPDIMPTVLGLCGVKIPDTVEGEDFSVPLRKWKQPETDAALIMCVAPFGQFTRAQGGREYRGIRTKRYTYVRDLNGPWLLFDNKKDPHQLENLCGKSEVRDLQAKLEKKLQEKLKERHDDFLPAEEYVKMWGYAVDETGTVRYSN
ncbi:MAG: sulfatase [FCB group bacterium]|jgi:arylsulfatase A-like enzyme|nr:sulfatase [FCB group bacterium]